MQSIIGAVKNGWPTTKRPCSNGLSPFYEKRSQLIVDNGLVFARERLVVPTSMKKEMLTQIHRSHIGIEGCLWRAREVLYWPLMNAEVKGLVSKRPTCQAHQPAQCREELKPYPIPFRPGETVSINLFELGKQHIVLLVDQWSAFFEVQELTRTTADKVILACKVQFARHGMLDTVITDNGPQFSATEFSAFARDWQFKHLKSSLRNPKSNGQAENEVKTCKTLMAVFLLRRL